MRRRALLATLGGLTSLTSLAGCARLISGPESYAETQETVAEYGTASCPDIYATNHTVCTSPPEDGPPLSLTPNTRTLDLSADDVPAVQITLVNDSRDEVGLLIRDLRAFQGGSWQSVTGWQGREIPTLAAGETRAWSFSTTTHPTPAEVKPVVYDFQPGIHAFTVAVELTPERDGRQDVELSAVFEVVR